MKKSDRNIVATTSRDGALWSIRTGTVLFNNGELYRGVLNFCDSDSGEHYDTKVWHNDKLSDVHDIGLSDDEVFPYKYKADIPVAGDCHINSDGWSN